MSIKEFRYQVIALALVLFVGWISMAAACIPVVRQPNDNATITQKKIEYAMSVISNPEYLARDKHCAGLAMHYLAENNAEEAIPKLISLLGYRTASPLYTRSINKQFPAIDSLSYMGASALPALIRVIAQKENSAIESKNAVLALMSMQMFREQPGKAIAALMQAADKETDPNSADRLRKAAQDAKEHWCVAVPCNGL